jgi:hypothetical protein
MAIPHLRLLSRWSLLAGAGGFSLRSKLRRCLVRLRLGVADQTEAMWRLLWDFKGLVGGGLAVCDRSSVRPRLLAARKLSSVNPQRLAVSRFSGLSVSVGWVGGFRFS